MLQYEHLLEREIQIEKDLERPIFNPNIEIGFNRVKPETSEQKFQRIKNLAELRVKFLNDSFIECELLPF